MIIHVASMDRGGRTSLDTILKCVRAALTEAENKPVESVALAAFGTGPGGDKLGVVDLDRWLGAVGVEIARFLDRPPTPATPKRFAVLIVLFEAGFADQVGTLKRSIARYRATTGTRSS